jgi:hypothetical protein
MGLTEDYIMRSISLAAAALVASFAVTGCGDDEPAAPLSAFEPEIISRQDSFEFQVSDAVNMNATLEYSWPNSGAQAAIDHSSAITSGSASVSILDAGAVEVYSGALVASANQPTASGEPGTWTIRVMLSDCSGTLNFRAEKL